MSEPCKPCQQIICTNESDVGIFSTEGFPDVTPPVTPPAEADFGNDALEYCCTCP